MRIIVNGLDGSRIAVEVEENERIKEVKKKIGEKIGLLCEEQILVYSGRILENDKTVGECGIRKDSVIILATRLKNGMQIVAKTMDGKTAFLEIQKTERVSDIKKKIQEKIGLAPDEQKLVFQEGNLEDDKTVDEYQIAEKSEIYVHARLRNGMQIFAKTMDGRTIPLEIQKTERVSDIKKKIQEKIGLAPDEQKLVFQGGNLEDDKTVDEYQIAENSVITVIARLRGGPQIFAKTMDGKTVSFGIQKTERVSDIKKKIQEKIGLALDVEKLVFQGGILEDDKTVDEYQIPEKSVINVVARSRGINNNFNKSN